MPDKSVQCPDCDVWLTFPKGVSVECPFCARNLTGEKPISADRLDTPEKVEEETRSHQRTPDATQELKDFEYNLVLKEKMRRAQIRTHFRWMKELVGTKVLVNCQSCGERKILQEFRVPLDKTNKIIEDPVTGSHWARFILNEIPVCGSCFYACCHRRFPKSSMERKNTRRSTVRRLASKWYSDRKVPVPDPPICPVCKELRSAHYNAWVTFDRPRAVCRRCFNLDPRVT